MADTEGECAARFSADLDLVGFLGSEQVSLGQMFELDLLPYRSFQSPRAQRVRASHQTPKESSTLSFSVLRFRFSGLL